jgi:hypothetical protein
MWEEVHPFRWLEDNIFLRVLQAQGCSTDMRLAHNQYWRQNYRRLLRQDRRDIAAMAPVTVPEYIAARCRQRSKDQAR